MTALQLHMALRRLKKKSPLADLDLWGLSVAPETPADLGNCPFICLALVPHRIQQFSVCSDCRGTPHLPQGELDRSVSLDACQPAPTGPN